MVDTTHKTNRGENATHDRAARHTRAIDLVDDVGPVGDTPLLSVADLNVSFGTARGRVNAVRGVSYDVRRGETLGIVGESGSGKSVTSLAVMGLLPKSARVTGSVRYKGRDLLNTRDRAMSRVRGKGVAMIFQDPMTSLDPVYKVGQQIAETLKVHDSRLSRKAQRARAVELLKIVGIPNPEGRIDNYPHEFSGGMRQRVVIAIAMANNPDVIIADEPTTALDVTVQATVLEAIKAAQSETGAALVLITHDLGVIAGMVDRVLVMYGGRAVETGTVDDVFYRPRMPYTVGLLNSLPKMDTNDRVRLTPISGTPPSLQNMPPGCPFGPRCPLVIDECRQAEPELVQVDGNDPHFAACVRTGELEGRDADSAGEVFDVEAEHDPISADLVRSFELEAQADQQAFESGHTPVEVAKESAGSARPDQPDAEPDTEPDAEKDNT